VLDDGNAGGEQQRVRGTFAVGGVVDVDPYSAISAPFRKVVSS
jgi:hypothetical protein